MIGLAGQIGRQVIILILLEGGVAEIAPEYRGHAEFMSFGERMTNFNNLAIALLGAKINGGADRSRAHVISLLHRAEQNLIELVGVGEKFVVIDFHDERNPVGILAGNGAEHAKGGRDSVAAALDGELDDIFSVE